VGWNPRLCTCLASSLPLSYAPSHLLIFRY
jgi:hypothetical protein